MMVISTYHGSIRKENSPLPATATNCIISFPPLFLFSNILMMDDYPTITTHAPSFPSNIFRPTWQVQFSSLIFIN